MRKLFFLYVFLCLFFSNLLYSQSKQDKQSKRGINIVEASINYRFLVPGSMSMDEARIKAEEEAMGEILAREFGVSSHSISEQSVNDNETHFYEYSQQEYKGEWVETLEGPNFKVKIENNQQILEVFIKGVVREIISSKVLYEYNVLRNGLEDRFISNEFKNGDDLFVSFHSPVDGYLAIYISNKNIVQRLLPYKMQNESSYKVRKNEKYIFFSMNHAEDKLNNVVTPLTIYTDLDVEYDDVYIIFSPNEFSVAADSQSVSDKFIQELKYESFRRWLSRAKSQDYDLNYDVVHIKITK